MNRRLLLALALVLALVAAACGGGDDDTAASDDDTTATSAAEADHNDEAMDDEAMDDESMEDGAMEDTAFPVTVAHGAGEITLDARPERIVSLSPTATEMLFAIGAGDQVIAVDDQSNYPAEAPTTDLSGFNANLEAILSYEPDLVVHSFLPEDIEAGLATAGIPSMSNFAAISIDDVYTQIEQLGAATGHVGPAAELVAAMTTDIDAIVADIPERDAPLTYYHELDDTLFSVTSTTFIGSLYTLAGYENVADPADEAGGGYPQLSPEFLLDTDPDVIFLADTKCCAQTAETVAARDGWSGLSAVENGNIVELDDDVASRWGPRVVDLLQILVDAGADIGVPAG